MQDEEYKGAPPLGARSVSLDIGGYEDDSEDELEKKSLEKSAKDVFVNFTNKPDAEACTTLVVLGSVSTHCLAKIMYGDEWQQVGEATKTKTSAKTDADKAPKCILKLFSLTKGANKYLFALPEDEMGGDCISPVVG